MWGPVGRSIGPSVGIVGPAAVVATQDEAEASADVLSQMNPAERAAVADVLARPDDLGDDDDDPAEPTRCPDR